MIIDHKMLDALAERAKESPRLRMTFDLRNSVEDGRQRISIMEDILGLWMFPTL